MPRIVPALFVLAACTPRLQPEAPQPPNVALGERVFRTTCAPCHGVRGRGDGPAAPFLDVPPRVLVDAQFRWRTTPSGELPTDRDLLRVVTDGIYGTPMRGFRATLTPHQRRSVVAFVESLNSRFAEPTPRVAVSVPPAPRRNVDRGRIVWRRAGCAECHGARGRGDGPSNPTLVNERGQPNPSHDFSRGYLKRGLSRESIYLSLRTGLDGSPMPSFADALPDADLWALADFTLSLVPRRGFFSRIFSPVDRDLP